MLFYIPNRLEENTLVGRHCIITNNIKAEISAQTGMVNVIILNWSIETKNYRLTFVFVRVMQLGIQAEHTSLSHL